MNQTREQADLVAMKTVIWSHTQCSYEVDSPRGSSQAPGGSLYVTGCQITPVRLPLLPRGRTLATLSLA